MKYSFIYVLCDPLSIGIESVRYVGYSTNPKRRLAEHIREARSQSQTYKSRWLREILADGSSPRLLIIEKSASCQSREIQRIAEFRKAGCRLVNLTIGGEGNPIPTAETRQRMSKSQKARLGRYISSETKQKISRSLTGRKGIVPSPEHRAKISAALKGRVLGEGWRQKLLGRIVTPETRKKISDARTGSIASAETRAKMSASGKGKCKGPNPLLVERNKNRVYTPEMRLKMSESAKARWSRDRTNHGFSKMHNRGK